MEQITQLGSYVTDCDALRYFLLEQKLPNLTIVLGVSELGIFYKTAGLVCGSGGLSLSYCWYW